MRQTELDDGSAEIAGSANRVVERYRRNQPWPGRPVAFDTRVGRSQHFASIGTLTAAVTLGLAGYIAPMRDRFFITAILELLTLVFLFQIRPADISFCRACGAFDLVTKNPRRIPTL